MTVQQAATSEVIDGDCAVVAARWLDDELLDELTPAAAVRASSLEKIALDRLVKDVDPTATRIVGLGGGTALDAAKYVGWATGRPVQLVPTQLSSIAPFTDLAATRRRRQIELVGPVDLEPTVLDTALVTHLASSRTTAGAAEVIGVLSAMADWRMGDRRGEGVPLSQPVVDVGMAVVARLEDAADAVSAGSVDGVIELADLLDTLGQASARAGHRRVFEGAEHWFVQAFEHRLGRTLDHGPLVAMGTLAMGCLRGDDNARAAELIGRCGIGASPRDIGVAQDVFTGILRHAVRFAVGERLPWSILNEGDINTQAALAMWSAVWQAVPARTRS